MMIRWSSLFLFMAFISACGDGGKPEEVKVEADPLESKKKAVEEGVTYYLVPTPNELFGLVDEHIDLNEVSSLNPVSNSAKYIDAGSRAMNFGVYATDLIYASRAQNSVEVARYFLTVKKLAEEMGVSSAFDDNVFRQLESDVATGDSLGLISLEAYYSAYDALEKEEKGPELALLVTGGWLESMYLAISKRDTFELNGELEQRISEQKFTLDNLIELNMQHGNLNEVDKLELVRSIYDSMPLKTIPSDKKTASGRMVLGDDNRVEMSKEQYEQLKATIESLRSQVTMNDGGE